MENKASLKVFTNGIFDENPVLVLMLGTCPTLALTTIASNSIGMGIAFTFVLLFSNILSSLLKNIIPQRIRIPAYTLIIAGFVSIVEMLMHAFFPTAFERLGVYLPLIVVNCIIIGRVEAFASKNTVLNSTLDALGMGIGFTAVMFVMGTIRELFGSGTWMGFKTLESINNAINKIMMSISGSLDSGSGMSSNILDAINRMMPVSIQPAKILQSPAGGFFVYGVLMALMVFIFRKLGKKSIQPKPYGYESESAMELGEES